MFFAVKLQLLESGAMFKCKLHDVFTIRSSKCVFGYVVFTVQFNLIIKKKETLTFHFSYQLKINKMHFFNDLHP